MFFYCFLVAHCQCILSLSIGLKHVCIIWELYHGSEGPALCFLKLSAIIWILFVWGPVPYQALLYILIYACFCIWSMELVHWYFSIFINNKMGKMGNWDESVLLGLECGNSICTIDFEIEKHCLHFNCGGMELLLLSINLVHTLLLLLSSLLTNCVWQGGAMVA